MKQIASAVVLVLTAAGAAWQTARLSAQAPPQRRWPDIKEIRGPEKLSPEARQKVEAAIPAKAPAKPKKHRKLLVMDRQVNYPGHPSIPYANYAVDLMGKKTGAWEATFSNDQGNLQDWEKLRQYDALYLNNTVGPLFTDPQVKENLLRFVREGGGLMGNHGSTHCSMDWPEFSEMIGARNGPHRDAKEKLTIKLDDPKSPLTAMFHGEEFVWQDEFFRFPTVYTRDNLHILMSIDVPKSDMNQGTDCAACIRADNDYAVSWIRSYGKGRVFYCSLGHTPDVFMSNTMLQHFLAGFQFALGDLKANTTPSAKLAGKKK